VIRRQITLPGSVIFGRIKRRFPLHRAPTSRNLDFVMSTHQPEKWSDLQLSTYLSLSFDEWADAPEVLRNGQDGPENPGWAFFRVLHGEGFKWIEDLAGQPPGPFPRALTAEQAQAAQAVASYWEAQAALEPEETDEIDMSMLDWRPSAEAQVRLAEKKAAKRRQDHAAGKAYLSTLRSTLDVHAANRAARDARQSTK
jgi:hypothetical protein